MASVSQEKEVEDATRDKACSFGASSDDDPSKSKQQKALVECLKVNIVPPAEDATAARPNKKDPPPPPLDSSLIRSPAVTNAMRSPLHVDVSLGRRNSRSSPDIHMSRRSSRSQSPCHSNLSGQSPQHTARDVGPLDMTDDPSVVYTRLQNFAQRRRSIAMRSAKEGTPVSCAEPITPFVPHPPAFDLPAEDLTPPARVSSRRASPVFGPATSVQMDDFPSLLEQALPDDDMSPGMLVCRTKSEPALLHSSCMDEHEMTPEEEEEEDAERVQSIMWHLEEMNSAAADLNMVQEQLKKGIKDRDALINKWADDCARLTQSIGAAKLLKAKPFFQCRANSEALQKQVDEASAAFLHASEASSSSKDTSSLATRHAVTIRDFLASKKQLAEMEKKLKIANVKLAQPYYDAEEEYQRQLKLAEERVEELERSVEPNKQRYRQALRNLEELSEQAHRMRGTIVDEEVDGEEPVWTSEVGPLPNDSPRENGLDHASEISARSRRSSFGAGVNKGRRSSPALSNRSARSARSNLNSLLAAVSSPRGKLFSPSRTPRRKSFSDVLHFGNDRRLGPHARRSSAGDILYGCCRPLQSPAALRSAYFNRRRLSWDSRRSSLASDLASNTSRRLWQSRKRNPCGSPSPDRSSMVTDDTKEPSRRPSLLSEAGDVQAMRNVNSASASGGAVLNKQTLARHQLAVEVSKRLTPSPKTSERRCLSSDSGLGDVSPVEGDISSAKPAGQELRKITEGAMETTRPDETAEAPVTAPRRERKVSELGPEVEAEPEFRARDSPVLCQIGAGLSAEAADVALRWQEWQLEERVRKASKEKIVSEAIDEL